MTWTRHKISRRWPLYLLQFLNELVISYYFAPSSQVVSNTSNDGCTGNVYTLLLNQKIFQLYCIDIHLSLFSILLLIKSLWLPAKVGSLSLYLVSAKLPVHWYHERNWFVADGNNFILWQLSYNLSNWFPKGLNSIPSQFWKFSHLKHTSELDVMFP